MATMPLSLRPRSKNRLYKTFGAHGVTRGLPRKAGSPLHVGVWYEPNVSHGTYDSERGPLTIVRARGNIRPHAGIA